MILIFMLSLLSGDISVGGAMVGMAVGGVLVGAVGDAVGATGDVAGANSSTVGVGRAAVDTGGTAVGGRLVGAADGAQATTTAAAKRSPIIRS
jgi:hypothetical protein